MVKYHRRHQASTAKAEAQEATATLGIPQALLRDFYDFIPQARAAAKRHAEEHAKEAARSCFFFRDLYKQLLSGSLQFSPLQIMFHVVLPTMQATEVASLQLSLAHAADEDCCAAPMSEIHISAVSHPVTRIFNLVFASHLWLIVLLLTHFSTTSFFDIILTWLGTHHFVEVTVTKCQTCSRFRDGNFKSQAARASASLEEAAWFANVVPCNSHQRFGYEADCFSMLFCFQSALGGRYKRIRTGASCGEWKW